MVSRPAWLAVQAEMTAASQAIAVSDQNATKPAKTEAETYHSIDRLRRQYNDYAGAKDAEGREMVEARHYYHGDQWTRHEIEVLRRRKQPVVTSNRIVRKIDAVVGLVERLRQDPKAYARTPRHQEGADLATATLRFVLDSNDWKSKSSRIARDGAVDGISGIEYDLVPGDEGDPSLEMHIAYGDGFFYDPRSFDEGFTDARYLGVAKWVDIGLAIELFPDYADDIENMMETGSDLTTVNDQDKEKNWINVTERKARLVDHWYILGGKWKFCSYIGFLKLMEGVSPFIDEKGKTFPRYRMWSANVDHDGDRYGPIRNLKSPQNEVNHRRSKALHNLSSRRVISEKGAVDDIEVARREWAKPDGWVETNPGLKMEPDDAAKYNDFKGQLEMLQEAKNEIENFGPNPALIGQGLEDSSGRAIQLLQQAGIAELGPYLSAYKNWKIRVYRDIWNIIQRYWTSERWIRVTDDQQLAQYFQINKLTLDQFGRPAIVNDIGSLDVDIIIDEGPDAVNMAGDSMMVLQSLGPQFAQNFPEIAIELSPLPNSIKKPMLDKIQAKQQQPPPPDPKIAADAQLRNAQMQADLHTTAADNSLEWRKAQLQALTQIEVARISAKTDTDGSTLAARLEATLGFVKMAHEATQNAHDRTHEALQNDADRRQQQILAARQQAAEAAQQGQQQPAA
jgi:hypothetical protein